MMKKALTLLAVLCIAMTATACVYRSNQQYYERAQLYLGSGDAEYAAELFAQLGEYGDSAEYALYAAGIAALEAGDLTLARTNLESIDPFKSSSRYLTYIAALEAELADELETALALYEQLGTFRNAHEAADELRTAIPEAAMREGRALMSKGEYAAARELFLSLDGYGQSAALAANCTSALNRAAYTAADKLCEAGDHLAAMQAFLALGDVLDAPDRAQRCRDALYEDLTQQAEAATLETAGAIIAACETLGDEESAQLAAALTARYGVNMDVLAAADGQPYVMLGQYPTGESGIESALLWQVIAVSGPEVTLLCTSVIDASPIATPTDLTLPQEAQSAVTGVTLPSAADLTSLTDLHSPATPYAVAQGVATEDGSALYWLRDSLENGMHPVATGSGLSIPQDGVTPGVRPVITLSLEEYTFTAGDGTMENPFR
ncbi:MAG: hypothetical protein IKK57_11740 [Clostridia bacterium]|nr:hypothetical protein [Clostridia bacterium]